MSDLQDNVNIGLLTEEELSALGHELGDNMVGTDGDEVMQDADTVGVGQANVSPTKTVTKPAAKAVTEVRTPPKIPFRLAKQVALVMVDGKEDEVDEDILSFIQSMSMPQVNEWLIRGKNKQIQQSAVISDTNSVLAETLRKQSMASALGRPQFFTGKGEWSHWLASFMPWLALQTVNTDAECIGMALSFIKDEALTHFKNSRCWQCLLWCLEAW